jgi:chromosome segregation ATPase
MAGEQRVALDLDTGLKLANFAFALAAIIFTWFATRRKDLDKRLYDGSKRMDAHDLKIQKLEQQIDDMPTKGEIHDLNIGIERMNGNVKAILAQMEGLAASQIRMERTLGGHEKFLRDLKLPIDVKP